MRVGRTCGLALAMVLALGASARAQELVVRTLEHGEWTRAIVALQSDPRAEGGPVHVVVDQRVTDRAFARASCGRYVLLLDAPGQRAFRSGTCDPRTGATELYLVDRRALFDEVARPRIIQIAVFQMHPSTAPQPVRVATPLREAEPTIAEPELDAGVELRCGVALEPYVTDPASGERIRATPGRFALRPVGEGARVEASSEGWIVAGASLRFAYELVDRQSGAVVHRDSVAMTCTRGAPVDENAAPRSTGNAVSGFPIERVLSGSTSEHTGRCGGDRAPEHVYTLDIDRPMWLSLRVESRFDAAIYLRNERGDELDCSVVRGQPGEVRLPRAWAQLAPGTYYVVIDGMGPPPEDGWYRLAMDFVRLR
jgi:hypothetical protein